MAEGTEAGAHPFAGKRILVVEDEFLIALDIENILESAGARTVMTASRVSEALAIIAKHGPFDAVVLDLKLERESSLPVAEHLMSAGVPFIFLTGASTEEPETQRFEGAPVLGKPFDAAMLVSALSRAVAARR